MQNNFKIANKIKRIVWVQVTILAIAVACQYETTTTKNRYAPDVTTLLTGLIVGLVLGWLITLLSTKKLANLPLRLMLPIWVGMVSLGFALGGLFFGFRVSLPMDWRPVITAGLLGSLPGTLFGGLISWRLSRDIIAAEAVPIENPVLSVLSANLKDLQAQFPGTTGELFVTGNNQYAAKLRVPRTKENLIFYVICDDNYPKQPPTTIAIETELPNNETHPIPYDAPIVYYWDSKYGLRHIVQEALQVLVH